MGKAPGSFGRQTGEVCAMQIYAGRVYFGKNRFLTLFLIGMAAGFLFLNLGKSALSGQTGMFDAYTLYGMKNMTVDCGALFCYVLRKRFVFLLCVAALATTRPGYGICLGTALWCGAVSGAFPAVLFLRYGLKGLLLTGVALFPQYLVYLPVFVLMLEWSADLHRTIYAGTATTEKEARSFRLRKLGLLGILAALTLLGCLLESYVNPSLLLGYLKKF